MHLWNLDRSLTGPLQHYHGAQWDDTEPMKSPINTVTNQWSCIVVRRAGLRICCSGIGKTKGHKTDNPTSGIWNFQNHITHMQETGKDWSFEDGSNLKCRFTLSHRWKRVSYERNVSISFMHQLKTGRFGKLSWQLIIHKLQHLQVSSGKLSSSSRVNQSLPAVLVPIFFINHEWLLTVSTQMERIWKPLLTIKTRFCQQWWWKGNTINNMHNLLYYWLFSLCSFWDCAPGSQISTFTNQDVNVFPRGLLLKTLVSCSETW